MASLRKLGWQRRVLQLIAAAYGLGAFACLLFADEMAAGMGIFLNGVNGYSQFYAIYVGTRLATAALALLAARPGQAPILGDLTALFMLAQPAGRLVAATAIGLPHGPLLWVCALETALGIALLLLRPGPVKIH